MPRFIYKIVYWSFFVLAVSVLAASSSFLFLKSLDFTLEFFQQKPSLLFLLPGTALLTVWAYKKSESTRNQFPALNAPLVLFATLLTHGSGGSAGREAVAVQMSEALTKQLHAWLQKLSRTQFQVHIPSQIITPMAVAAGFSAIFGTPWAALLYAFEPLISRKSIVLKDHSLSLGLILAASFLANFFCLKLGASHTQYLRIVTPENFWTFAIAMKCLVALAALALATGFYSLIASFAKDRLQNMNSYFLALGMSLLVILLSQYWGTTYFSGLGLEQIRQSFIAPAADLDAAKKALMTLLTQWAGLKGGEVTPLFAIGASLGSTLAGWFDLPVLLLASCGFIAFFAGQSQAPWASAMMGVELFGLESALYFVITAWACAQTVRFFLKLRSRQSKLSL